MSLKHHLRINKIFFRKLDNNNIRDIDEFSFNGINLRYLLVVLTILTNFCFRKIKTFYYPLFHTLFTLSCITKKGLVEF